MKTQAPAETTSGLRYVKGIGPKRALALEKMGIRSIRDLFYFFPRRYEDRSRFLSIDQLQPGQTASIRGEVMSVKLRPIRRLRLVEITIGDASGIIHAVWFNQPYLKNQFQVGAEVILYGRVDLYKNRLQINSPEYEFLDPEEQGTHTGRITPVYPLTEGLFQRSLRTSLHDLVERELTNHIQDFLPPSFREKKNLIELRQAIMQMHFPNSFEEQEEARRRIVFDEFLVFEITMLDRIRKMKSKYKAHSLQNASAIKKEFLNALPFNPTQSQSTAMESLAKALEMTFPMNRLLQGDVGCGKTVVAAYGLLLAAKNKKQGALLVPTEILAEQHTKTIRKWLEPLGIKTECLTSATTAAKRERILGELKENKIQILVGTHAILREQVRFSSLALIVIDEQHKFGVHQRHQLLKYDPRPHQLVMTATPIPRTLALTSYADLEVSVIKELPAGRQPIKTYWVTRAKERNVLEHIRLKIEEGEQAYFIFPLIEETEKLDLLAAKKEFERLRKGIFSKFKMGLIHGKLSHEERKTVMKGFKTGEIKILVSTTVIEVGVDNPNANVMVIENAERFGLAQLHQMRGRIGRGERAAECFLFGEPKTFEGKKRLKIMTETQDGFYIAEEDLKLRGPGDFWGTRQSGEPLFRHANPLTDFPILLEARETAQEILQQGNKPQEGYPELQKILHHFPLRY